MRGRWPRRAGWARIGERIGVRRSSGGSAPSSRWGKRWWGRGPRYISVVRSLLRREGVGVGAAGAHRVCGAGGRAFASAMAGVRDCTAVGRDGEAQRRDPCCRRSARQASEDGCGGSSSVHGARRGGCDGDRVPSDAGRGGAFSRRASGGVVPRAGAAGDELWGKSSTAAGSRSRATPERDGCW